MDFIDEILFKNRERVKKLVTEKKTGKKFCEQYEIPYERLVQYKESIQEDLRYCKPDEDVYTNYDEFKFRTSDEVMTPRKYRDSIPIKFKDISSNAKHLTEQIKKLSKTMLTKKKQGIEEQPEEVMALSISEELFVQNYIVTRSARRAAENAGYQGEGAGHQLANRPHIQRAITERLAEGLAHSGITVESVLNDLEVIQARGMQGHPVLDQDGIFLGEWKADYNIALKALELKGKYLKMFSDRVEHTGKNGGAIQIQVEPKYDLSKLTIDELEIFKRLREKIIEVQQPVEVEYKKM